MLPTHLKIFQKHLIGMMKMTNNMQPSLYAEEKFNITVDQVNHPEHYTSDPSGVECIQITRHRNFNVGNAFKYLWRAGLKDESKTIQDLEKAIFYIKDEINRLEGKYDH
jgi:hypothetical protein